MNAEWALLALTAIGICGNGYLAWQLRLQQRHIHAVRQNLAALAIEAEQAQLASAQLATLQAVGTFAQNSVSGTTATVRTVHEGIASIPFGILENIPVTAAGTKAVRNIHDATVNVVYSAIDGVNKNLGKIGRAFLERQTNASAASDAPDPVPPKDQTEK